MPDQLFIEWMLTVDRILFAAVGLRHLDMDDYTWYDTFLDGVDEYSAARDALENADPLGLLPDDVFAGGLH